MDIDQPQVSLNACSTCKQGKRKCNRARPNCSTCSRVGRNCHYEEDTHPFLQTASSSHVESSHQVEGFGTGQGAPSITPPQITLIHAAILQVDPFKYDSLRQPTVNISLCEAAAKVLGSPEDMRAIAARYFDTIWKRQPIVCKSLFYGRLPNMYSEPKADLLVLCLSIHLLLQVPAVDDESMISSLYVFVKSQISLYESAGVLSLEFVQARLLVVFYEVGHGIHPGASISIAAAARSARLLGLNKKEFQNLPEDTGDGKRMRSEAEKRVWWAVMNLDRNINMTNGDSLFCTEDPKPDDLLPIEDSIWAAWTTEASCEGSALTLLTPSDIRVGPFARECQIAHLLGRSLRHVFDPTPDLAFHFQEAAQIERTLLAFMPFVISEQMSFGLHCAAVGMCSSALFLLYDSALLSHPGIERDESGFDRSVVLQSLETASTRIVTFSCELFRNSDKVNTAMMSPLIPHSLYQAALVQYRCWKETGEERYRAGFESLREILKYFERRWLGTKRYVEALEELGLREALWTTRPLSGVYVSAVCPEK